MNSGSLVDNRSNPYIFITLAVLLAVAAVLVLIKVLMTLIRKQHTSAEWIEAQKKLPTKKKNVEAVAREARLSDFEAGVLYDMCRHENAPNIEYLVRDDDAVDALCRSYLGFLRASGGKDEETFALLSVRFKLEKLRDAAQLIRSTQQLQEGQSLVYIAEDKTRFTLTVAKLDGKALYLTLPDPLLMSEKKPQELSKMQLSFLGASGITYKFDSRAMRYETAKDGRPVLAVSHAAELTALNRRQTKRMQVDRPCTFCAAKDTGRKDKAGRPLFDVMEKSYGGTLQDISAEGCRMLISMPIVSNQHMRITFSLDGETEHEAVGIIIATRRSPEEDGYILHVRFVSIERSVQNEIYRAVYGYLQ